jgi:hypothetical protein
MAILSSNCAALICLLMAACGGCDNGPADPPHADAGLAADAGSTAAPDAGEQPAVDAGFVCRVDEDCDRCNRCTEGVCDLAPAAAAQLGIEFIDVNGEPLARGDLIRVAIAVAELVDPTAEGLFVSFILDNFEVPEAVTVDGQPVDMILDGDTFSVPIPAVAGHHQIRLDTRRVADRVAARVTAELLSACGDATGATEGTLSPSCVPALAVTGTHLLDRNGLPTEVGDVVRIRTVIRPIVPGGRADLQITVVSGLDIDPETVSVDGQAFADAAIEGDVLRLPLEVADGAIVVEVRGTVRAGDDRVEVESRLVESETGCTVSERVSVAFLQVAGLEGKSDICRGLQATTSIQVAAAIPCVGRCRSTSVFRQLNGTVDDIAYHRAAGCSAASEGSAGNARTLVERTSTCVMRPEGTRVVLSGDAFAEVAWGVDNIFYFQSYLREDPACDEDDGCPNGFACDQQVCRREGDMSCEDDNGCALGEACLQNRCRPLFAQMVAGYLWPRCPLRFTNAASAPLGACENGCGEDAACVDRACRAFAEQAPGPHRPGTACGHTTGSNFCFDPGRGRRAGEVVDWDLSSLMPAGLDVQLRATAIDYHVTGMVSDLYLIAAPENE